MNDFNIEDLREELIDLGYKDTESKRIDLWCLYKNEEDLYPDVLSTVKVEEDGKITMSFRHEDMTFGQFEQIVKILRVNVLKGKL